jgi:hypothetical protein
MKYLNHLEKGQHDQLTGTGICKHSGHHLLLADFIDLPAIQSIYSLDLIPHNRLRSEIRYMPGCILKNGKVYLTFGSELALSHDHPALLETASGSYHLLHAGAGISIPINGQSLSLDVQVRNLLNTNYIDHLSTLKPLGYLNMGRNIVVNLSIPLLATGT